MNACLNYSSIAIDEGFFQIFLLLESMNCGFSLDAS